MWERILNWFIQDLERLKGLSSSLFGTGNFLWLLTAISVATQIIFSAMRKMPAAPSPLPIEAAGWVAWLPSSVFGIAALALAGALLVWAGWAIRRHVRLIESL